MAGVYKRESDKARGKRGKWTAWWIDYEGKRVCKAHGTDKAAAQSFANQMEAQSKNESYGLADPRERTWKEHARKPIVSPLIKAVWCPAKHGWIEPHDITQCGADEHIEIVVGMRSVYQMLNSLRRFYWEANVGGVETLASEISDLYEDVTMESLADES